jgi:phosphohistidine phosphatase
MITLIRHASAADAPDDAIRPLTVAGRASVRRLAEFLQRSDALRGSEVWHSSLARARETAEELAAHVDRPLNLKEVDGLAPDDPPGIISQKLAGLRKDLIVVGHNPHLTILASVLVKGDSSSPAVVFDKCCAVALENYGGGNAGEWAVTWCLPPELFK